MSDRPILITIIGVLTLLLSIGLLAVAVMSLVAPDTLIDLLARFGLEEWAKYGGYPGLIVGVIMLLIGAGFMKGWAIIWYLGMFIYAVFAILCILALVASFTGAEGFVALGLTFVVPLVVSILVIYYLTRPGVKSFFNI